MEAQCRSLERRVDAIITTASSLEAGTQWRGKRTSEKGDAMGIILFIDESVGNAYKGRLRQTYQNGTSDIMEISGTRSGSAVKFQTTAMKLGAARHLVIEGYIIGNGL